MQFAQPGPQQNLSWQLLSGCSSTGAPLVAGSWPLGTSCTQRQSHPARRSSHSCGKSRPAPKPKPQWQKREFYPSSGGSCAGNGHAPLAREQPLANTLSIVNPQSSIGSHQSLINNHYQSLKINWASAECQSENQHKLIANSRPQRLHRFDSKQRTPASFGLATLDPFTRQTCKQSIPPLMSRAAWVFTSTS